MPVGSIPAQTLEVGETLRLDVTSYFRDPDGGSLTYTAASLAPGVVSVSQLGAVLTMVGVAEGTATVTVTATDPGGLSAAQNVGVTVFTPNQAPEAVGSIPAQSLDAGETVTLEVSGYFRDPDGDALTYTAATSAAGVVSVSISGSRLTVVGVAEGRATVTVTAADPGGLTAAQSVAVAVQRPNRAPEAVGSIPGQSLDAGARVTLEVSGYFRDPDGDALTYTAATSNAGVVSVSISGSSLTVVGVAAGRATVTVTAADPGGLTAVQSAAVAVQRPNRAPEVVGSIPAQSLAPGRTVTLDVTGYFRDPDGDALTYTAATSNAGVVAVSISGSSLTVTGVGAGQATVTVTAADPGGLTAVQSAAVAVQRPNRAPEAVGSIPAQSLDLGQSRAVDVSSYFRDPEGDALTYTAATSNAGVVAVSMSGSSLTVTGVGAGRATVTVTAADPGGLTAAQSVAVTVQRSNRAPEAVGSIPAQSLDAGGRRTLDVTGYFRDPDGDALTYTAATSNAGVASVSISGGRLTVVAIRAGSANVQVTAADSAGLTAMQNVGVTVRSRTGGGYGDGFDGPASLDDWEIHNADAEVVGGVLHLTNRVSGSLGVAERASPPMLNQWSVSARVGRATRQASPGVASLTGHRRFSAARLVLRTLDNGGDAGAASDVAGTMVVTGPGGVAANVATAVSASGGTGTNYELALFDADRGWVQITNLSGRSDAVDERPDAFTDIELGLDSGDFVAHARRVETGEGETLFRVSLDATVDNVRLGDFLGKMNGLWLVNRGPVNTTIHVDDVVVNGAPTSNRAPEAVGSIPAESLNPGQSRTVDVSGYFRDPDGDALRYAAATSNAGVASVSLSGSRVIVTGVRTGSATVTVRATDPGGLSATQTIAVTVQAGNRAPVPVGSIPAQSLNPGQARTFEVSGYFRDPDGNALTYAASSSNSRVAVASASGSQVTVTGVAAGSATVTVTARDPAGLPATQTIAVTVQAGNRAPVPVGSIPAESLNPGQTRTVDVSGYFRDPDGDALSYAAASSNEGVATASVSGSQVAVVGEAVGSATVTVTASDPDGLSATQTIAVTVETGNRAPVRVGSIPAQSLNLGQSRTVDVSSYFRDPDGDVLTYAVSTSNALATASVSGSRVTVTGVAVGSATVTVTASDPAGRSASQTIAVTVGLPNRAPETVGSIPAQSLEPGQNRTVDVPSYFRDPDGDALTYTASTSNTSVATVSVSGSQVTVTGVAPGSATVTVTASDPDQLSATQTIAVTVRAANRAPEAVGSIPRQSLLLGQNRTLDVASYFTDPDGDALRYTASVSPRERWVSRPAVVAAMSGSRLTVTWKEVGFAVVTVTATDSDGLSATQRMFVDVTDGATRLTDFGRDPALYPRWSPDGTEIAFTRQRDWVFGTPYLWVVKTDGHTRTLVSPGYRTPRWSPDGAKIAATRDGDTAIYVLNAADFTGSTRLASGVRGSAAWSPDGRKIAFSSERSGSAQIHVINADGSDETRLTTTNPAHYPAWSPDGAKIAFQDHNLLNLSSIYVMNADGSGVTQLVAHGSYPAWSPDGTKIAFQRTSTSDGAARSSNVFVMNADGSGVTQLTPASDLDFFGGWSPDGARIVFSSIRYGDDGRLIEDAIFVMNADGSGVTRLTTSTPVRGVPQWSPDGAKLVFSNQRDDDDVDEIYVMDVPDTGNSVGLSSDAPEQPPFERTPPRR